MSESGRGGQRRNTGSSRSGQGSGGRSSGGSHGRSDSRRSSSGRSDGGRSDGDFNGDGDVDFLDFLVISAHFGQTK